MIFRHSLLLLTFLTATSVVLGEKVLLGTTTTTVALGEKTESASTQNLIDWIRKQGGIYSPKQEVVTIDGNRGVRASEDIEDGEIILQVPWDSIIGAEECTEQAIEEEQKLSEEELQEEENSPSLGGHCRAVRALYAEVEKGGESKFAPHITYLFGDDKNEPVVPSIPALWSKEGRDFLDDIQDHGLLPPKGLFRTLNTDWYGVCIQDFSEGSLEGKIAGVVSSHQGSGSVLSYYGLIVPLFDNYHYTYKLIGEEDKENARNALGKVTHGEYFQLVANRKIKKGEEIVLPYGGEMENNEIYTSQLFRDAGIVSNQFPQFYQFEVTNPDSEVTFWFGVDVDEFDAAIDTLDYDNHDEEVIMQFLSQELNRLNRLQMVVAGAGLDKSIPKREWNIAWQFYFNLSGALEKALEQMSLLETDGVRICPGGTNPEKADGSRGTCPIWDGFEDIPDDPIDYTDLEFNENNPYGPSEESYSMCNDAVPDRWASYKFLGAGPTFKSQYQEIEFTRDPETMDTIMRLDGTTQQISSYRPHYHEFAVHFPARFLETVKRVLFVGGGDSMVLHEYLKYPSVEKVVGLELDQYVVRNSFRYFHTQPHFNDKRVEWWFGDGAKSLLMLPKEYYQSFDLVVVDLSETVMSFQVTNKLSIFQTLSLLLKPDGILLKNGEYYMEKMSQYFDYTLQYFEYNVPFICDQGMVIGSNKIDFFNRTMKDHGVELLVLEPQDEINEKHTEFYRFTEYRKNNAQKQGHCKIEDLDDGDVKNAGILMVVEAEKVTHDLKSTKTVEETISKTLAELGFSLVSVAKHDPSSLVIITKEGYVTARLFPEKAYVGLDIQLWANFDKMGAARDALVKSLGGTEEGTSSFRIVTGGMIGSPFEESDRSKTGPRMVNSRDCEVPTLLQDTSVDLAKSSLLGSLTMIEDGVVAAVVCGNKDTPCSSLDILNAVPDTKFKKVLPIYTCESMENAASEFAPNVNEKMAACEVELSDLLGSAGDKISLLVFDDSARKVMGKVFLSIFTSIWNRKRVFAQNRFLAFVRNNSQAWRRNLLLLIREKYVYKPMSFVDVVVENAHKELFSMLSLYDPNFFAHLDETVNNYNKLHDMTANMWVETVYDGLPAPLIGHFNPRTFKPDDYDEKPGKEQHAGQTSLGRQSLMQFSVNQIEKGTEITAAALESSLVSAVSSQDDLELTSVVGKDAGIGNGLVVVAFTKDGDTQAIVTWDGKDHVVANLFSRDENPELRDNFIKSFAATLRNLVRYRVQLTLSDTHPRGIGRVVSFPGTLN